MLCIMCQTLFWMKQLLYWLLSIYCHVVCKSIVLCCVYTGCHAQATLHKDMLSSVEYQGGGEEGVYVKK